MSNILLLYLPEWCHAPTRGEEALLKFSYCPELARTKPVVLAQLAPPC